MDFCKHTTKPAEQNLAEQDIKELNNIFIWVKMKVILHQTL